MEEINKLFVAAPNRVSSESQPLLCVFHILKGDRATETDRETR